METKQATSDKTSDKGKRLIYAEDLFEPPVKPIMVIGGRSGGKTAAMYEQIFRKRVEMAPTADAAPVVHGHWFLTEVEYLNCSVCGEAYYTGIQTWSAAQDNLKYAGGHKFCPNCGAKMDGGASS